MRTCAFPGAGAVRSSVYHGAYASRRPAAAATALLARGGHQAFEHRARSLGRLQTTLF